MKTLQSKKASWSEQSIFSLIILIVAAQGAAAQTNTFPSSGNAGVGTTSPTQLLQINTSTSGGGVLLSNTASAAGTVTPIGFKFDVGSTAEIRAIKPNAGTGFGTPINTDLSFRVWDSAVAGHWSEALYLKSNGNVGIGTTAPGSKLDVVGNINTSTQYNIGGNRVLSIAGSNNAFVGVASGFNNNTGGFNSFFGTRSGFNNTTGPGNSFFGWSAGEANITGTQNSFFGLRAGLRNTGSFNNFFGANAGQENTTGEENAFFGGNAGFNNTTGQSNSFFGGAAGSNSKTGNRNIVIGYSAGTALITGSNNIFLANAGADESNRIRIGTQGTQKATFIAGISGTPVVGDTVFVNANGQLGVGAPSSRRFKQDIVAMGNASSKLMQLRPVVFYYRPEYVTGKPTLQYGLIAEEVASVYPELVGFGEDGKPQTVRYHLLNTLLLNEVQKQKSQIQSQEQQLKSQARQIADLEARLRRLEPQASTRRRRR